MKEFLAAVKNKNNTQICYNHRTHWCEEAPLPQRAQRVHMLT